jgi:hypothetical protein
MSEHPHGVWIWFRSKLRSDYLDKLVEREVKRVYLKVFDGRSQPMFWSLQCSPDIIQQFKSREIEVYGWGLHYGTPDVNPQVSAVKQALDCGLDGYVLNLVSHVEDPDTHPHVKELLIDLRPLVKPGTLGYTSFAHPGFHPQVPWHILDQHCDIALPQIYFEMFTFKPTNEEEVQACLKSQQEMGLTKPMLPIWSSSPNVPQPASASELQQYLKRFPGSSIWRLPHVGETGGQAWKLTYRDEPLVVTGPEHLSELPVLTRMLRQGDQGEDVEALQRALNERGFNAGPVNGDFGPLTEAAVKAFQTQAGITADGIVGPETWGALGGSFEIEPPPIETGLRLKLANLAQKEAAKGLRWTGPNCEAEKYLEPLRKPMQDIGHIGAAPVFYNWCAAFVTWCCREVGAQIPDIPEGFWATMALVESWKFWAQKKGYWFPRDSITPRRGDILVFEWFDGDLTLDHIGIVSGYTAGNSVIQTYEGNSGNQTANRTRQMSNVPGFIRIMPE